MNILDNNGTFSQELVIEGMKAMEEKIKEENAKETQKKATG